MFWYISGLLTKNDQLLVNDKRRVVMVFIKDLKEFKRKIAKTIFFTF